VPHTTFIRMAILYAPVCRVLARERARMRLTSSAQPRIFPGQPKESCLTSALFAES
jgi:hypothetical protein